ncbi:MAG: TetR family transcriptional regulator C-terminal domain-containing protein [Bacillaceae bacterium]|nr:TetR family transcriptional regulator C-terminal domain-containing protein [Bacillaceae bacterium]
MTSKLDRRKKYTRMVLKESLMTLLKEKPISSITVKELCEVADINRSTFYSHYSDQFDLLYKIEEEIIEDMNETLSQYNFTKEEEEALQMTEKLLEYVAANKDICQTLFSEHGDPSFQKRVMLIAHQYTVKGQMASNEVDKETSEYISMFVVSGSIHVIKRWLDLGMDKSPKEMAELVIKLTNKGLGSF